MRRTLFAITVASGITSLPTTALGVAIPAIHDQLNASLAELQWTLTAYSLVYASLLVAAGRLGDIFGHRKVFLAGTAVFGTGALSAALARDPVWLILSLGLIGAGAAMLAPASLSIVTHTFRDHGRARAIALWGGASGLVSGLGPPIGGILTKEAGWPSIFWVVLAVAVVVFAVAYPAVAESADEEATRRIDYAGVVCIAGMITSLTLGLIEGGPSGWTTAPPNVSFGLSILFLAALVFVERRSANPIIELGVLRHRNFIAGMTVKLIVNFILAGLLFLLPVYLQEILEYSPLQAGLLMLPLSGTFLVSLPLGARLLERYGPRLPLVGGLGTAAVCLWFVADISISTSYAQLWPPLLGLGFAVGLVLTPMNLIALNAVPLRQHGQATGIMTTVIGFGGVLGVTVVGAVFRELEDRRLDAVLHATGPRLDDTTERALEGVLSHADDADALLATFSASDQAKIVHALRSAFVYGISNALIVAVGAAAGGALLTLVILKRARPKGMEGSVRARHA
jgi:EmrB/QacA subfamily drug resistance transporter